MGCARCERKRSVRREGGWKLRNSRGGRPDAKAAPLTRMQFGNIGKKKKTNGMAKTIGGSRSINSIRKSVRKTRRLGGSMRTKISPLAHEARLLAGMKTWPRYSSPRAFSLSILASFSNAGFRNMATPLEISSHGPD